MTHGHGLWFWLTWACVIWYSTVTVYVSIRGVFDIKHMLRNLKETHAADTQENVDKKS